VGCKECGLSEPWEGKVGRSYSEPRGTVMLKTQVMNGHFYDPNNSKLPNFLAQRKHCKCTIKGPETIR
jgi:hypothetical protein